MILRAALLVLLLAGPLSTRCLPANLRAGAATANITPPLGIEINGGTRPDIAVEVHDELLARALVLDDGTRQLAIVVVDNCLIDRPVFDAAKALVHQHTGIPSNHVCLAATHTHSAGSVVGAHLSEPDPEYRAWLPRRIADAVRLATRRLAPAEIAWGSGSVPQHVFNRRVTVKPGVTYTNLLGHVGDRAKMNWSSPEPAVDDAFTGPVDPELFVVNVRHADGRPLALLANYSLHYVGGVGPGHLSADYFGVFAFRMSELLDTARQDPPFVAMLSNGTSGDINNLDYRRSAPARKPYEQIRRVAEDVAQETLRVLQGLHDRHVPQLILQATHADLEIPVRKPDAAELSRARGLLHGRDRRELRTWTEIYAREQLLLADLPDRLSLPLQVFRIGALAIAQWPGEIFAVSGLDLKRRSPGQPLFNMSLANGWYGYIPPPEQHALGAYETWRGRTSPLATNAIPQITREFIRLLSSLGP
jgi:neutral ceramidase